MTVHQEELIIDTNGHGHMTDLTALVEAIVERSGVRAGTVNVFNIGSTAAIGTIEFEPGLKRDLPEKLDELFPPGRQYGHEQRWHDGNAHSHLQATILGPELTVPIRDGSLVVGTWQQIVHLECDVRARQREVIVTVQGV